MWYDRAPVYSRTRIYIIRIIITVILRFISLTISSIIIISLKIFHFINEEFGYFDIYCLPIDSY